MKKNNLLILCHELSPIGGGAGNFSHYLTHGVREKEAFSAIIVISSNYKWRFPFRTESEGVIIYRLPIFRKSIDRASPLNLAVYALFAFILGVFLNLKYRFRFVLAVHGIPAGWPALAMKILQRTPYGICLRGSDIPGFVPEKFDRLHKPLLSLTKVTWKKAQFITFNAIDTFNLAKKVLCGIEAKSHIIPNGVDRDFFRPGERQEDIINIVYSGRLTEQKNLGILIDAMKKLLDGSGEKPRLKLKIAGSGNLMPELKERTAKNGLDEHINFLGWLGKKDLRDLYATSHIFVLPSLYEGMSNSLLEAISSGLAVVSGDFEGYNQMVRNDENGYLFERGNANSLTERLQRLAGNRDAIDRMGLKSREIAKAFSWNAAVDRYCELIS